MGAKLYSQYKNRSNTTLIAKNVNSASFDSELSAFFGQIPELI